MHMQVKLGTFVYLPSALGQSTFGGKTFSFLEDIFSSLPPQNKANY